MKKIFYFLFAFLFFLPVKTYALTDYAAISINGNSLPYQFGVYDQSTINLTYKIINDLGDEQYTYYSFDMCVTGDQFDIYRTYSDGQNCNNSCFTNNINKYKLGRCSIGVNQGYTFRVFGQIKKWTVNTIGYNEVSDILSIRNYNGYYLIYNVTDWDIFNDDRESQYYLSGRTDESLNDIKDKISEGNYQQHQDSIDLKDKINQGQIQQHQDSLDTKQAINDLGTDISEDDSDSYGSFFDDFDDPMPSSVSSVLTAPLSFISTIDDACTPVTLDVLGSDLSLPCGDDIFWNKESVASFRSIWNILFGGSICYMLLIKVFKLYEQLLDPTSSVTISEFKGGN